MTNWCYVYNPPSWILAYWREWGPRIDLYINGLDTSWWIYEWLCTLRALLDRTELNNVCACVTFGRCFGHKWSCVRGLVSKLNVVVLRQTGHFFHENNWEVAWAMLLVVDCGSWCCFKRPFEDVRVCDRSVKLESFRFTAFFCKTVYSLSIFMCYWNIFWLKLFWN